MSINICGYTNKEESDADSCKDAIVFPQKLGDCVNIPLFGGSSVVIIVVVVVVAIEIGLFSFLVMIEIRLWISKMMLTQSPLEISI